MNELQKNKSGRRLLLMTMTWLALFAVIMLVNWVMYPQAQWGWVLTESTVGASLGTSILGMCFFVRWLCSWRNFRRFLVGLAVFATLMAIFYTEENWRGKRAWENCKRELE